MKLKSGDLKTVKEAIQELLDTYVCLVDSGDAGFWNPEEVEGVKKARAALGILNGL